jgi:molybdopterin-synthase adenylyltransferase
MSSGAWTVERLPLLRYQRQIVLPQIGPEGQRRLAAGRVLIVGVGGLGTWAAELLARAGVGFLRLVDDDRVELTNLHRQALFGERDAAEALSKPEAAAWRLREVNSTVRVEAFETRVDRRNIHGLAEDVDVILDGTDNWPSRFLINDYAARHGKPWVMAGVVGTEAQTAAFLPGRGPCLRCLLGGVPRTCDEEDCRTAGVLGPAVAAVAAFEAAETLKILAGRTAGVSRSLLKFDLWRNTMQQVPLDRPVADCPCCQRKVYEFLEP